MKIAFTQDVISGGGRIVVLIEIISVLNEMGHVPDVLSFRMDYTPESIVERYGVKIDFRFKKLPFNLFYKLPETSKIWFNHLAQRQTRAYDLIIDSNNTTLGLGVRVPIVSYVHYPRIDRVYRQEMLTTKRNPRLALRTRWAYRFDYWLSRWMYRRAKMSRSVRWLANSEFTRNIISRHYPTTSNKITVIYPPVRVSSEPVVSHARAPQVVTLGRFSVLKRQLDQIKIAQQLPHIPFVLMGFARSDSPYLAECRRYLDQHAIANVRLLINQPYTQVQQVLHASQFFLHTLENEPFGITTVEAIAAGCVPVVHNSGGQREIVPIEKLRFNTIAQAIDRLRQLCKEDLASEREQLMIHIQQFDKSKFKRNFVRVLHEVDVHSASIQPSHE